MLVSSDFLGYINRKKEKEKVSSPLLAATLKTSAGGKEKAPPVDQKTETKEREKKEEVEYLNERPSTLNVVL
ncbi:MAG: hypothetical protein LBE38_08160 [Deltaproteobacteria bacterium]|jgi:hypothetical protein|nr:hypothetical protein [Deltaproteobacteria bacterium]